MSRYDELLTLINACGVAPGLGSIGKNYQMEQNPVELAHFLVSCEERGVKSMLELGTGEYGGLALLAYKHLGWAVTSIDHRAPLHESGRFILGETSDPDVYAQVKDQRFDLVFLDAEHTDYAIKHDYKWYAPLADTIVALHDVAWGREGTVGVVNFWRGIAYQESMAVLDIAIPEDRDDFWTSNSLKSGYHEIIDPEHPIGIGWYKV